MACAYINIICIYLCSNGTVCASPPLSRSRSRSHVVYITQHVSLWVCLSKCAWLFFLIQFDFSSIFASSFFIYRIIIVIRRRCCHRNRRRDHRHAHSSSSGLTASHSLHFVSLWPAAAAFAHFHQFSFQIVCFLSLHLCLSVIEFKVGCCCCCCCFFASYVYANDDNLKHRGLSLHLYLSLRAVVIVIILLFHVMILLRFFVYLYAFAEQFFLFFAHLKSKVQKALLECYVLPWLSLPPPLPPYI